MKKKSNYDMYHEFSLKDAVVILFSLIAFAALLFVIRYSQEKSKIDQNQLDTLSSSYQTVNDNGSLQELQESLVINEVNQAGWIELYNKNKSRTIDLSDCYITVNGEKKYTFEPNTLIEATDFLCVEGLGELGVLENEVIGIYDAHGDNQKNLMIPCLKQEESYGCSIDGEIGYCFLTASKQKTNSESDPIAKTDLSFSVPGGFYKDSFQLELTAAEDSTIYYTLDGTDPTIESERYEEPILIENKSGSNMKYATAEGINYLYSYRPSGINMGMVVRAIEVDRHGRSSEILTQSYYIGLENASDYVGIPVLSITTSPVNLFDYFDGIYVTGRSYEDAIARGEDGGAAANYFNGWEKEVFVEYFEPNKDKTYEGKMKISLIRDISITQAQKSMLLTGEGAVFGGSSLKTYINDMSKKLIVQTNKLDNTYKVREYLAGKLLDTTTVGTSDITPCIVFIDGEYWGGYMLRAEYDEAYINKHYGVPSEEVLIAQDGKLMNHLEYQQEYDEFEAFVTTKDLSEEENYAWVKDHMDLQNYLEYLCANMYLANAEFGTDAVAMWRTIEENGTGYEDGKWRFLMPRLDNTMDNGISGNVCTSSINTFLQAGLSDNGFFQSLMKNEEFRKELVVVMRKMSHVVFTEENVDLATSEITSWIEKMAESSYKRYIGIIQNNFYDKEINKIRSFFEERANYIIVYTEEIASWEESDVIDSNGISE